MNKRFKVPGVDAHTPLGIASPAILMTKAEPLFELEAAARGGADIDAVHDMRVASRRLREALRLLGPLYAKSDARVWYRRIRTITRALGPVRDSDVFIDAFSGLKTGLGEGGRRVVAYMVGYRAGQRVPELDLLNRELGKLDLERNRIAFSRFAESLAGSSSASRPLADFAHAEVAARAAVVFSAQPVALDEANVLEQHALRIDYKRLRYAVEAFAPCYGEAFDELHATLTAFQDALGDLHDAHIFLEMLHDPTRTAYAQQAGVTETDIAEVTALLNELAHGHHARFVALATSHPAERLLPALLLPLVQVQQPAPVEELPAEEPSAQEQRGGAEQAASGSETTTGSDEPADEVTVAEVVDSNVPAEEFLSDGEDAYVVAPVIVGDEPWRDGWEDSEFERPMKADGPS